jgi:hypothetical protein
MKSRHARGWVILALLLVAATSGTHPLQASGIPLTRISGEQGVLVERLQMNRAPAEMDASAVNLPRFYITDPEGNDLTAAVLGSGFYRAAFLATFSEGRPFLNLHIVLKSSADISAADNTAALAVALIALSNEKGIPENTAVLGDLYPDGTLKPVVRIKERMDALMGKGIRRFVVPSLQTAVILEDGSLLGLERYARSKKIECVPVSTLEEAARATLEGATQEMRQVESEPVAASPGSDYLESRVEQLIAACNKERQKFPKEGGFSSDFLLPRAALMQDAGQNYDAGVSASRAGRFYEAYEQLRLAYGQYRVAALNIDPNAPQTLQKLHEESGRLLDAFAAFEKEKKPSGSILEGYAFLQTSHALNLLRGRLQSAENVVRKLVMARAQPKDSDLQRAVAGYAAAIEEVRVQMDALKDYDALYRGEAPEILDKTDWRVQDLLRLANRSFLDGGERFFYLMQGFPKDLRPALLYEPGFYTQLVSFMEARSDDESVFSQTRAVKDRRSENLHEVAFIPGSAFVPPEQAGFYMARETEEHPLPMLMEAINQISDQALLEFQFIDSEARFDYTTQTWQFRRGTDLALLLDQAGTRAETALREFAQLGIPSPVPELIYRRGRLLSKMTNERMKLEALREFWRCTQVCRASRVLDYAPSAVPVVEAVKEEAPQPAETPADARPVLKALPLSPEELEILGKISPIQTPLTTTAPSRVEVSTLATAGPTLP